MNGAENLVRGSIVIFNVTLLTFRRTGEVVYAKLFQTPVIIVNSMNVARELMDKRGAIYSDRPPFTLLGEV